jgi:hypothetical protein
MQPKRRIQWLVVFSCFILDVFLSLIIYGIAGSLDPTIIDNGAFSSTVGITAWVLGTLSTIFAGGVAGRVAKEERFLHGFLVGGIGIVFALFNNGLAGVAPRLEDLILVFVATPLAGIAGHLSGLTTAREQK